jgi:hypothetical protein
MDIGEKLLWRVAYKATGRNPWRRRNVGPEGRAYPTERWLAETMAEITDRRPLDPSYMETADLYNPDWLRSMGASTLPEEKLIGRMLAVEMAMRAAKNS